MTKLNINKNLIIYTLVFFGAMNFHSRAHYIIFIAFFAAILLYRNSKVNTTFFAYLMLGLLMALHNSSQGALSAFRPFAFAMMYFIGYNISQTPSKSLISKEDLEKTQSKTTALLWAVCLGSFVHFFLNFIANLEVDVGRNTYDFWTNEVYSATLQAGLGCLIMGLAVSCLIFSNKTKNKVFAVVVLMVLFGYNLILAGRTMIFMFAIIVIVSIFFLSKNNKKARFLSKVLIPALFLLFVLFLIFALNIAGLKDKFVSTNFYSRFFGVEDNGFFNSGRTQMKINHIKAFFDYPLGGGYKAKEYGYAHDLLLDAYDEYGIFCLIILTALLMSGIKQLIVLCKNKNISIVCRANFLCVYTAILLVFFLEPIFVGMSWIYPCYAMINGCISKINYQGSKKVTDENSSN